MARPKNNRKVLLPPVFTEFKPSGVKARHLEKLSMSLDEFEAIRLADEMGLSHEEASEAMQISRSTFSRLIERARKKVAVMLIKGKKLIIEGGNVHFKNNLFKCKSCQYLFKFQMPKTHSTCPECNSQETINLAANFGHGPCCSF